MSNKKIVYLLAMHTMCWPSVETTDDLKPFLYDSLEDVKKEIQEVKDDWMDVEEFYPVVAYCSEWGDVYDEKGANWSKIALEKGHP